MPRMYAPVLLADSAKNMLDGYHDFVAKGQAIGLGRDALAATTGGGSANMAIGFQAMATADMTASVGYNTAIGYMAMYQATSAAARCLAVGASALRTCAGVDNTALGADAGMAITTGASNTCVGSNAGEAITTGGSNTIVGAGAAPSLASGSNNTIIGAAAGSSMTSGNQNIVIGVSASAPGATYAMAIGSNAGASVNYAIAFGRATSASGSGAVAIGTDSSGTGANTNVANEFMFGTANHIYRFPGKFKNVFLDDSANINFGVVTGSQIGTGATQKIGWWGTTPVIRNAGWSATAGYTPDKALNPLSCTLNELAAVVATLIDALKSYGLLGG
jgi:hypothetical protein